uniref:Uncharacterized protein n=1 Tax=Chromera velia CCMP2878 TaxID=1169474 RepID=A0A0G4HXN7_9ALVE|eukprot:Cvel_9304.t1-p1 / transcript=Cvel_9304.t1 / gene=Cvel_9304 / organism=Chromera_velia_CCMP2878 / gene_product=hypothetical protein / transcript_product=hypothetical protein / location=Cvel_scaffold533:16617-21299(-) / protein_length=483 / sequence_SO=supercontig / SO=protein_coding / is_pseudo=false
MHQHPNVAVEKARHPTENTAIGFFETSSILSASKRTIEGPPSPIRLSTIGKSLPPLSPGLLATLPLLGVSNITRPAGGLVFTQTREEQGRSSSSDAGAPGRGGRGLLAGAPRSKNTKEAQTVRDLLNALIMPNRLRMAMMSHGQGLMASVVGQSVWENADEATEKRWCRFADYVHNFFEFPLGSDFASGRLSAAMSEGEMMTEIMSGLADKEKELVTRHVKEIVEAERFHAAIFSCQRRRSIKLAPGQEAPVDQTIAPIAIDKAFDYEKLNALTFHYIRPDAKGRSLMAWFNPILVGRLAVSTMAESVKKSAPRGMTKYCDHPQVVERFCEVILSTPALVRGSGSVVELKKGFGLSLPEWTVQASFEDPPTALVESLAKTIHGTRFVHTTVLGGLAPLTDPLKTRHDTSSASYLEVFGANRRTAEGKRRGVKTTGANVFAVLEHLGNELEGDAETRYMLQVRILFPFLQRLKQQNRAKDDIAF